MIKTFKKIWSFAGKEKGNINKSVFISFIYAIFSMLEITSIYLVLSGILGGSQNLNIALIAFGLILVSIFGKATMKYYSQLQQTHAGYFMVANKRIQIADKLKHVPMGYFNENSLGEITGVSTTVLETVEMVAPMVLVNVLSGLINSLIFTVMILVFDWRIGILVVAGTIIYLTISSSTEKKSVMFAPKRQKSQAILVSAVLEYIQGMSIVKSFNLTGKGDKTLRYALENNCESNLNMEKMFTPYIMMQELVLQIFSIAIILLSVNFYLDGTMTLLNTLMMVIVSFLVFSHIQSAGSSISLLRIVSSSIDEANKMDTIPEIDEKGTNIQPKNHDIEFKNVDFSYEERKILSNINIKIPQRTTTAIVGPSGSGKTTLCNLIARFWDIDSGSITIGGKNIKDYSLESLMDQISMVFQKVYLFADTVENNIKFGKPNASREDVIIAAKKACCHDFIMELPDGYDTVIGEGGDTLSGGEKQRLSIARALLKDSPIVILDEATANVDPENEDKLQTAIESLTHNKTIIMIAHRLKTVRSAEQLLVVDKGSIVQQGNHNELMANKGIYKTFVMSRETAAKWKVKI
ncbi:MAG: ABC transporter ATP-binding protein/permease [Anaeromicrobium sp.]|uniref:ABC transporter ATP-binding protein n=1 Tax=Anaeromicrobium sp. TaxID=1929132 RepID=UPI0025FF1070|nr:ABC transporter ATP-binding protein [Anaeromicrobium sp.]MCT4595318.1 ABC transporter ATP-binding protein/permease [Anaeromicrobium sp.]